jgi:hypothetical protein
LIFTSDPRPCPGIQRPEIRRASYLADARGAAPTSTPQSMQQQREAAPPPRPKGQGS